MGDEQRAEAHPPAQAQGLTDGAGVEQADGEDEQEHHRHAGNDIRVGQGDVVHGQADPPAPAAHAEKTDGGGGAQQGGDDRRQHREDQGGAQSPQQAGILKELQIPLEGKALPDPVAPPGVKGEDDEQGDGGVEEQVYQNGKDPGRNPALAHRTATPSSPSPKRFMTAMHTRTMTIITRAMAEPRWGL